MIRVVRDCYVRMFFESQKGVVCAIWGGGGGGGE